MKNIFSIFLILAICIYGLSCTKSTDPGNPYDSIVRKTDLSTTKTPIDSTSIIGLHTLIFGPKCAIPSCHGGPFEPDFRTPLSSYNTLVWQKVIKNTADGRFIYRVVPGDTTKSWLHERLVTDDAILGRMPRYMPPLNETEMRLINTWILGGAKDLNGNPALTPNTNIMVSYFFGYDSKYQRIDTAKNGYYGSFRAPANDDILLYFSCSDDKTPVTDFKDCEVKFSTSRTDFSQAKSYTAMCDTTYKIWYVKLNTSQLPQNQTIYMRFYGRDTDHTERTEFPFDDAYYYYFTYYSFTIQ